MLRTGAAGAAYGADDFAVDDDGDAAIDRGFEVLGHAAEGDGDFCLVFGERIGRGRLLSSLFSPETA